MRSVDYPDGNAFAERIHNSARREPVQPTEDERADFIESHLEKKRDRLGTEFIAEAVSEASEAELLDLFTAFKSGSSAEIGIALKSLVEKYWRPTAERAADEHDFAEDRVPCRCRGEFCSC
jgi:hypothetical protein